MIRKSTLAAIGASFILGLVATVPAPAEAINDTSKWDKEFAASVARGEPLYHGGIKVDSNGVACDQCHPEGAQIHPETYPKYQKQLGKVSQLWEMVNWCIENPLEGKGRAADDQDMVDIISYVTQMRKGYKLAPGTY